MKEGRNDFGKCVLLASYQQFECFLDEVGMGVFQK